MRFSKTDNIYKVVRITDSQDNILGVCFSKKPSKLDAIEIIQFDFDKTNKSKYRTSKEEVLKQVLSGLEAINTSLGTNYILSTIYFSPSDLSINNVYSGLIGTLIRHYHAGKTFVIVRLSLKF
jgi:hypothetical protein